MPRGYYPRKPKAPTWTSIFEKWIAEQDDFVTLNQIKDGTGMNSNQATATVAHFKKRKVIDFIESEGTTYWFYTPDTDDRQRTVEERVPEEKGTRRARVNNTK